MSNARQYTEQLLEMDGDAKRAGITALIGLGSSPGVANVLVRFCAETLLDQVEAVDIYHAHGGEGVEGPAVVKHRRVHDGQALRGQREGSGGGDGVSGCGHVQCLCLSASGDDNAAEVPEGREEGDQSRTRAATCVC